jgi:hypothetical protein
LICADRERGKKKKGTQRRKGARTQREEEEEEGREGKGREGKGRGWRSTREIRGLWMDLELIGVGIADRGFLPLWTSPS